METSKSLKLLIKTKLEAKSKDMEQDFLLDGCYWFCVGSLVLTATSYSGGGKRRDACQGADFSPFSTDDDNNNHLQEWWQTGVGVGG